MANAEAVIEGNQIVIRLAIENIPIAVEGGIELGTITGGVKVVNAKVFAKDLVRALNDEDEIGNSIVKEMFDTGFECAFNDGAQGVEYSDDDTCFALDPDYGEEQPEIEMIDGQPDWDDTDDLPW
jgi:hypothetical protein